MIFDDQTMLLIHIGLSFMALVLGIVAVWELCEPAPRLGTELFLVTGILTTVTGFFLPFQGITPAVGTGIVSSVIFVFVLLARFAFSYKSFWRYVYAIGMTISAYLLVFVTIAQSFQKVPPLKVLAPTGTEPAFLVAQVIFLALFVWVGRWAVKSFHPTAHAAMNARAFDKKLSEA